MSEMTAAEKSEKLNLCYDSIQRFFETGTDENICRFIFGTSNIRKAVRKVPSYVGYINNVLSLAFVFAYGCLKCDLNDEPSVSQSVTSQSALRIIGSLQKAYVQYPVTSELIQFVLTDIQFEMMQGKDSELYDVFKRLSPFTKREFTLIKYFKLIAKWRAAPSRFNMDSYELAAMFLELLKNMEFLANYSLVQDEEGNFMFVSKAIFEEEAYQAIPVNYLIYYNEERYMDMFCLFSMERTAANGGEQLLLRYICGRNSQIMCMHVGEEDSEEPETAICRIPEEVYSEIAMPMDDGDGQPKKNGNLITQVHAINYKYIKNLALAIADAIDVNTGSKAALWTAYYGKHNGEVFGKLSRDANVEELKLDWDSIIVMLLIEHSPTSVLETLFLAVEKNFVDIAHNLCKRLDNPEMPIYGLDKHRLNQQVDSIIRKKLVVGESNGFGRIPSMNSRRLRARAQAMLIISSLSAADAQESMEKTICAGNYYDNMQLLQKMKSGIGTDGLDITPEQRCKYVSIILSESCRRILCFYSGLLAYGEKKMDFDLKSNLSCLSETEIAREQKKLHSTFISAARQQAEALHSYDAAVYEDMMSLLAHLMEFCQMCGSSDKSKDSARRALFTAVGKYELLNTAELTQYIQGYTATLGKICPENVEKWIDFAFHLLEYMRNGTFGLSKDDPVHAIYPYTATYDYGNENYDGYKTVTFTLNYDVDGDAKADKKEVKVLSEFHYSMGSVYYCLPNVLRISNKWWIDPVLINFKEFNEIFID